MNTANVLLVHCGSEQCECVTVVVVEQEVRGNASQSGQTTILFLLLE